MTIKMVLHTNPHGRFGGADFEVERVPGTNVLRVEYDENQFPPETYVALAELARGVESYASEPTGGRGPLPSAIFRVTKLYSEPTEFNLPVYSLAGYFGAGDYHERVHAESNVA